MLKLQEVFKELCVGDIILEKGKDFLGDCIANFDRANYCHAMIYIGGNQIIHSGLYGVEIKSIVDALTESEYFQVFRLNDTSIDFNKVIMHGKSYIGAGYGYSSMLLLALILLSDRVSYSLGLSQFTRKVLECSVSALLALEDRDESMICSEFVYRIFEESVGSDVINIDRKRFLKNTRGAFVYKSKSLINFTNGANLDYLDLQELYNDVLKEINSEDKKTRSGVYLPNYKDFDKIIGDIKSEFIDKFNQTKGFGELVCSSECKSRSLVSDINTYLDLDRAKFVTPGDLAMSPSLKPVFDAPIHLNNKYSL